MLPEIVNRLKPLPKGSRLVILGGGFTGQCVASLSRMLSTEVLCSRRMPNSPGADFSFDSALQNKFPESALKGATHLLSCIPPDQNGEDPGNLVLYDPMETILPKDGTIIIFSSKRVHSVSYKGNKNRVVIGVNFYSI